MRGVTDGGETEVSGCLLTVALGFFIIVSMIALHKQFDALIIAIAERI